ncbi:conserved exported hypothetical protein [Rhodococcus sp. RD6.2]|nr:conserved exported hypothetical protein [Rhodococcus sp. RD6.2]
MDRHRYLAAAAWAATIAATLVAVSATGMDVLASIVVWGTAAVGGVLATLATRRRSETETSAAATQLPG